MAFSLVSSLRLAHQFVAFFLFAAVVADVPFHTDLQAYQAGALGEQPRQSFYSAPHIHAPIFQVNKFNAEKVDTNGYLFMSGNYNGETGGYQPSMFSARDLSLVWSGDEAPGLVRAVQTYMFKGQPVIGYYAGAEMKIVNQEYRQLYRTKAQLGPDPKKARYDAHEGYLTHDDHVIMIQTRLTPTDMRPIGGPKKGVSLRDCYFQEIDPVTDKVVYEFRGLDHFNLTDTIWPYTRKAGIYQSSAGAFDYCHMNSVEKVMAQFFCETDVA